MTTPAWLPEVLSFHGNWEVFIKEVYAIFERDFKKSRPSFRGLAVTYDARMEDGREAGFWHIVQRDDAAAGERLPDFKRCGRIPWPRSIIEHPADSAVSIWENERKKTDSSRQTRILVWLEDEDYLVVLGDKKNYMILVTAYCVDQESYKRKLRKERDEYYEKQKPPGWAT